MDLSNQDSENKVYKKKFLDDIILLKSQLKEKDVMINKFHQTAKGMYLKGDTLYIAHGSLGLVRFDMNTKTMGSIEAIFPPQPSPSRFFPPGSWLW